jgi:hypothetical protein
MSIVLPCKNTLLRSRTTQRPCFKTQPGEWLDPVVEKEMAILFLMETDYLIRLE